METASQTWGSGAIGAECRAGVRAHTWFLSVSFLRLSIAGSFPLPCVQSKKLKLPFPMLTKLPFLWEGVPWVVVFNRCRSLGALCGSHLV